MERVQEVTHDETRDLIAGPIREAGGELGWEPFNRTIQRVTRRVILGDAAAGDWALTETLERMMSGANGMPGEPADELEAFERRIQAYADHSEEGSLAAAFARAPVDELTKPAGQVTHWLFALGDTLALNALRALAVLASHDEQLERALDDTEGAYLDACLHEAMRLWPSTTMLSRVSLAPTEWHGAEVPEGTQLVISNTYLHRDRDRLEYADRFAPEQWTEGDAGSLSGRSTTSAAARRAAPARRWRCWSAAPPCAPSSSAASSRSRPASTPRSRCRTWSTSSACASASARSPRPAPRTSRNVPLWDATRRSVGSLRDRT